MHISKLFKTLLIAVAGFGLFSCSSDNDEPKTPETDNNMNTADVASNVSASDFDSKVKGRMWVLDNCTTVMSDGTEYDKLFLSYLTGSRGIEMAAFHIDGDQMSYFWTPASYKPGLNYYSREDIPYSYDENTGHLTVNTVKASKRTFTILSVSETELTIGDLYGETPKDFNPEKYDQIDREVSFYDMDPGSYIKLTLHPATAEEAAYFRETYQENE